MSEFFQPGCLCPVCDKEVLYRGGRRRCSGCKRWCHQNCSLRNGPKFDDRSTCFDCINKRGPTLAQLEWSAEELDKDLTHDPEYRFPALMFLCSLWTGVDEARIAQITKVPSKDFEEIAANYRKADIWSGDIVHLDKVPDENDPGQVGIMFIVLILCGAGMLQRAPAEPGVSSADAVPPELP